MKKILKRLPHIRRRDHSSDPSPASPSEPAGTAPSSSLAVFLDSEGDDTNEQTTPASNQQPATAQSKDGRASNPDPTFDQFQKRESALASHSQVVDNPSPPILEVSRHSNRNAELGLPSVPQHTSLYGDLSYPTLGSESRESSDPSRKRYSEDVADRNIMTNERGPLSENLSERKGSIPVRAPAQVDEFSEDIADRNIEQPNLRRASIPAGTAPWKPKSQQFPIDHPANADSGFLGDFDMSSSKPDVVTAGPESESGNDSVRHKSLPHKAQEVLKTDYKDLDLNDSTDIDFHTRYAPAVTHETVIPEVRHVRDEVVTREIHTHDVYHRILPIKDVEVLPAKHFARSPSGKLVEIPTPPGREGEHQNWKIVSTEQDSEGQPLAPRPFTARAFEKEDRVANAYMGEDGVAHTETTWIHPPTIQDGGRKTGQTEALFMDEQNDPSSSSKSKGVSRGCPDGVHDSNGKFGNGDCDGPEVEKAVRGRPVTAQGRHE